MRNNTRGLIVTLLFSIVWVVAQAQSQRPQVSAIFSKDTIMLGDQFYLDIKVDKDQTQITEFPIVGDTLVPGIEVIREYPTDTVADGRNLSLTKRYLLTSFDHGSYRVEYPILYIDKNITDTLIAYTDKIFVNTFEIDTTKQQIHDIKPQQAMPVKFGEFSGYLALTLLAIGLITLLVIWLVKRYKQRKQSQTVSDKPKEAPEVIAIRALEALQNEKLWQSNRHKLYYTRLTDIIRTYIDHRWDINSMEMTTSQTLDAVKKLIPEDAKSQLSRLLTTADYVKFAKYTPEVEDNEMSWNDAYNFVEQTKAQAVEEEIPQSENQ